VGRLDPALRPARPLAPRGEFYDHRIVLVTVNDYSLGLFNGDVGVVLPDGEGGGLGAWFERTADGGAEPFRRVPVRLLPEHETAFAMTVHKSQGSEFDRVALVLPPAADSPILTRELLYTGVTRARTGLDLWCTESAFRAAVARRTARATGLRERLAGGEATWRNSLSGLSGPQASSLSE
jgi:exodeoxyribonuclease V alpha subunit